MPKAKKQSKATKVLNWLNPSSPAKGALLFVIVFAVIGGSYMAFKSFAAESAYNFDVTAPNLYTWSNAKIVHDSNTYASKSGTTAISMSFPAGFTSGSSPEVRVTNDFIGGSPAKTSSIQYQLQSVITRYSQTRTCAVLRVLSSAAVIQIAPYVANATVTQPPQTIPVTGSSYHKVCGSWTTIKNGSTLTFHGPIIDLMPYNNKYQGHVYLYSISIEAN